MNQSAYERVLQVVLDTVQSTVAVVDCQNRLCFCKLPGGRRFGSHLVGKPLNRLLKLLLQSEAAARIMTAVNEARKSETDVKVEKLSCENRRSMEYYFHVRCCSLEDGRVVIFLNNITESVLLLDEFSSMLEEHVTSVTQLEESIAKLEMQLLDK